MMQSAGIILLALVLSQFCTIPKCGALRQTFKQSSFVARSRLSDAHLTPGFQLQRSNRGFVLYCVFEQVEEDDDRESFQVLAENYLAAKFHDCVKEECIFLREEEEVKNILKSILPPVTADELKREVDRIVSLFGGQRSNTPAPYEISISEFVQALMANPYWAAAGPLVVKELIYLDCLYNFYHRKKQLLSNDDFDELKNQLNWEGSIAASLRGKEALFITAVAAHHRGSSLLSNSDYMTLKDELLAESSWVVNRQQDPLERMGLKTFMSYLHRSL